ncbi:MAG TPA: CoA-transferase [Gammaproteobacteria bacterium]
MTKFVTHIDELAAIIGDGATLAVPPDYSGCAMSAVRALIRRGARDLHLLGVPQIGFQGDMLIGAGCVRTLETAALTLGEFGAAPRFNAAIKSGRLQMRDSTCPAIHAGLQAAEKGIPFMPLRGILDSDVLAHRSDWKTLNNPFEADDPLVVLPAIRPDVTLFHAALADRNGNVWIGVRRELMLAAHASKQTLVTVEEVSDANLLENEHLAPGTIPALYISAIATAPNGAWPVGLAGRYAADTKHLAEYVERAQSDAGFLGYLEEYVLKSNTHAGVPA